MKQTTLFPAVLLSIVAALVLPSCRPGELPAKHPATEAPQACDLRTYRSKAEPLMYEFAAIASGLSLYDHGSRVETLDSLDALLTKIDHLPCKDTYPFKHETLELTVRHTIDAIHFSGDGDDIAASQSLDKALATITEFKDWNFDVP